MGKAVVLGVLLISIFANAQVKRAERMVDELAHIEAIKIYEYVAKRGHESQSLFRNLADSYYFNGNLVEANKWYAKLFGFVKNDYLPAEYYYRYAQTLKSVGEYEESDIQLKLFKTRENADQRALLYQENKDYLELIKMNSGRYLINKLNINTKYSDYGSTVYRDQLVFASARDTGSVSKKLHSWTGDSFTSLYTADIEPDGSLSEVKPFSNSIKSRFNESTPVFSKDGQTMYFTRNNYLKGKRGRDLKGTTLLKIYKATSKDGKWIDEQALSFNSDQYSTAHPALTADGKWMYFVSDREGGFGQSDLYKVPIGYNGNFGEPVNLGEQINTEGRESFPFITVDNELYFSTDGRPGLGGLDIYATKINADGSFTEIQNIGAPANSSLDDFAYYINSKTRKGFLSSNRPNGEGSDDIYAFVESRRLTLDCLQTIEGLVYDKKTNKALVNAILVLYNRDFDKIAETKTTADGRYRFEDLICGNRYRINASIEEFNTAEVTVDLAKNKGITQVDFGLENARIEVKKGDDLFKILQLEPIYFDYDKSNIRSDAALELTKVVMVLNQYPKMKIDVRSHTDSRGKDSYNLNLSDQRAKSTIQWMVNEGIEKSRLSGKGYGETQLINNCRNGVKCTEAEHEENRRSEFIVLEL